MDEIFWTETECLYLFMHMAATVKLTQPVVLNRPIDPKIQTWLDGLLAQQPFAKVATFVLNRGERESAGIGGSPWEELRAIVEAESEARGG